VRFNITASLTLQLRAELLRPPLVGEERLCLVFARYASQYNQETIVASYFLGLPEEAYLRDLHAPVSFNTRWLMSAAEAAAHRNAGVFLTHLHEHKAKPWFSPIDMRTNRSVLRPMALIDQTLPTGALLLSLDQQAALLARSDGLIAVPVREVPG
jgi:hypothetical protein